MTKILSALFLAFAVVTAAAAADMPAKGVTIPNKNGAITFNHDKHKDLAKCEVCHGDAKGDTKIKPSKEWGHKTCQECHKANKAKGAKIDCKSCHSGPKA